MSYLDTRDLDNELDELQQRADAEQEEREEYDDIGDKAEPFSASDPLDDDERERLSSLTTLRDEFDSRDWRDGVTLIPESDFEDYARETAEDIGDIPDYLAAYIDWERFADAVRMDYSVVEFDGETYYYRA